MIIFHLQFLFFGDRLAYRLFIGKLLHGKKLNFADVLRKYGKKTPALYIKKSVVILGFRLFWTLHNFGNGTWKQSIVIHYDPL